jgi:hypothetical protein
VCLWEQKEKGMIFGAQNPALPAESQGGGGEKMYLD